MRNAMMKTLLEAHPGQFGMKYLAQYIWWPHINRQIYFHGINCSESTSASKNLKTFIPNLQTCELPPLLEPIEELNLDFAGLLDSFWWSNKYIFFFASIDFLNFLRKKLHHLLLQKQLSNFSRITYSYLVYRIQ